MSKQLAHRRSPNWAFMETFKVPQYDGDDDYLTRLRIVQRGSGPSKRCRYSANHGVDAALARRRARTKA